MENEFDDILINGINFRKGGGRDNADKDKVNTKARKKKYITGAHGSDSARQKARYRQRRAKRISHKR